MAIPSRLRIGSRGFSRAASLAVWAVAAGCAVHWGLQVGNPGQTPVQVAASGFTASADVKQVGRLLGHNDAVASVAPPVQSSRYDLMGVVARGAQGGAAIISVDGRPARAYLVGREVGEAGSAVRLSSVGARSAVLMPQQGDAITLHMKALDQAHASGTSPAGVVPSYLPPAPPSAVPMPEGPSETEQAHVGQTFGSVAQAPRVAATQSLRPGAMRLLPPDSQPSSPPAAALRQPGAAVSNAAVFGVVN